MDKTLDRLAYLKSHAAAFRASGLLGAARIYERESEEIREQLASLRDAHECRKPGNIAEG